MPDVTPDETSDRHFDDIWNICYHGWFADLKTNGCCRGYPQEYFKPLCDEYAKALSAETFDDAAHMERRTRIYVAQQFAYDSPYATRRGAAAREEAAGDADKDNG